MDFTAACTTLAGKYEALANSDASATLRASHATAPDNVVTPCAVTMLAGLSNVEPYGSWLSGTADIDVLILLDPAADVPRRYAALLRWVGPALTAAMSGNTLGQPDSIAATIPADMEVALAGDSDVYAGLPWDMVRVRYRVPFRQQVGVTP